MASKSESKLNTYTIGFEEEGYNEFRYSRMVSELYDTNHTEITLDSKGYFSTMEELIKIRDSPLGVPNEVPSIYHVKETEGRHYCGSFWRGCG